MRGSSTAEFTLTTTPQKPPPRRGEGAVADVRVRRDAHALGRPRAEAAVPHGLAVRRAAASSSSRRRSATGASTSRRTPAASPRSARRPASARGSSTCTGASPRRPRSAARARHRLRRVPQPAAVQRAERRPRPRRPRRRVLRRPREGPLAAHDRPVGELAAADRRPALRRRLERRRLGVRRRQRPQCSGAAHVGGAVKGAIASAGGRLYVGSYDGHLYCLSQAGQAALARSGAAPPRAGTDASTRRRRSPTDACTSARPTARSTRSARRAGSCAGRTRRAATSTRRRRCGTSSVFAGSYSGRFYAFDAATGAERWRFHANGQDLRLGDRDRRRRLLRDAHGGRHEGRTYALNARTGKLAVVVPRREVHAGRRRAGPAVPDRLRHGLWDGAPMRYVVTGAAGFIGSNLAETLVAAGHDVVGVDCFTDYYDPAEKEENARGLDVRAARPRRGRARSRRRRRRLPPRGAGRRAQLRRRLPALRAAEPARDAARVRGGGRRRRTRRVRVVVVGLRRGRVRIRRPRTRRRSRSRPTASRSSAASSSRVRTRSASGSTRSSLRYFTVYGPRQRPDMFFRRVCDALLDGRLVRDLRHRRAVAQLHGGRRRGRGDDRGDGARRRREPSTTSAAATRRRCSRRSRCSSRSRAGRSTSRMSTPRRATSARTKADVTRIREALGWEPADALEDGLSANVVLGLR